MSCEIIFFGVNSVALNYIKLPMKVFAIVLLSFFCLTGADYAFSQTSVREFDFEVNPADPADEEKILEKATVLMIDGFLTKAEPLIDSLLMLDSANPHYNYLKGLISLYYHKDHQNSISYFSKAITRTEGKLDLLKIDTDVTNDVFYHLAEAYHFMNNFDEAERFYKVFLERSKKNSGIYDLTEVHLKQCEVARKLISNPQNIKVTKMDEKLCTYMTTLDLKGIKSAVLKDARLEVTFLLIGLQVSSYKQLWMHQLKALEAWADTASGAQVKAALREAGWF